MIGQADTIGQDREQANVDAIRTQRTALKRSKMLGRYAEVVTTNFIVIETGQAKQTTPSPVQGMY
jgi:hypothetical protein